MVTILILCAFSIVQGEDDALNPRNQGDWGYGNAPVPTHRQNCHPAMAICRLPHRPITKKDSDVNERALSGDRLGTPTRPPQQDEDALVGPDIGTASSLNKSSARSGPAIKY
jgi:hypothetical protein